MTDLSFLNKEKLHTGFGEPIINATSYDDVLKQAGLNWTVDVHPAYAKIGNDMIEIPDRGVVIREEDNKPLGIVSSNYKVVNNADAFNFTESIFNGDQIEFIRGGSYRGGSSTWLEAKVTGKYSVLGDDTDCYMIFKNTHDGTGSIICMIVPERIVCSNALNIPLKDATRVWRCVHSGDPMRKIAEAQSVLLAGSSYMEALAKEAEELNKIKLSTPQVEQFINRIFPINVDKMSDKQKENQTLRRDQLFEVYRSKDDLQNFDNNGYRFISAVADYVDHVDGRKTANGNLNRFMSVAHGNSIVDQSYNMVLAAA